MAWDGLPVSQWSKASRIVPSTRRAASWLASRSLVWPWNSGSRMKIDSSAQAVDEHVVGGDLGAALVAGELAIGAQGFDQRRAQARLMGAAFRRRHGVAIGIEEAVGVGDPGNGPFHGAVAFALVGPAGEHVLGDGLLAFDAGGEKVLQPAGEVQHRGCRRLLVAGEQRRRA